MAWRFLFISSGALLLGIGVGLVHADEGYGLEQAIRAEIAGEYPGAKIELHGDVHCLKGSMPNSVSSLRYLGENGRGDAQIQIRGIVDAGDVATVATCEGMVSFSAMMPAFVATRRVAPGEAIDPGYFMEKKVDVTRGQARELRGVIFPTGESLKGIESRQTILEGQMLTTSAVQRTPDVRRGDTVSIHLTTGNLVLTVSGTASEPAYLDGKVKVMSSKTKRELVGFLRQGSVVEVGL